MGKKAFDDLLNKAVSPPTKCDVCHKLKETKTYKVVSPTKTEDGKKVFVRKNLCDDCAEGFGKAYRMDVFPKG